MDTYEETRERDQSWVGMQNLDDYAHLKRNIEGFSWPAAQTSTFKGIIRRLLTGSPSQDFLSTVYINKVT